MFLAAVAVASLCAQFADYHVAHDDQFDATELAEMFANGNGVERDFDAAIHFVCASNMSDSEREGMLEQIEQLRRGETTASLDFCEHISGGSGALYCAERAWHRAETERLVRLDAVRRAAVDRKALDALRASASSLSLAEAKWLALYRGGTLYRSEVVNHRSVGDDSFIATLERYSRERAPAVSADEEKRSDVELNTTYRKRITSMEDASHANELREAERMWIAYRDAFVAYYVKQWRSAAPRETLRREIVTRLTRDRIVVLLPRED